GVLGPQLHLVEVEVGSVEVARRGIEEVGVDGEAVEVPGPIGKLLDAGELACRVAGVRVRVGEVLLAARKMQGEGTLRRGELVGSEEALEQGEAALAHLIEGGVGDAHRRAGYREGGLRCRACEPCSSTWSTRPSR